MNIYNKRRINTKTIENGDINFLQNDKNKFSKSQKSLKLVPRELINNFEYPLETAVFNNSINNSVNKQNKNKNYNLDNTQTSDLYDEEINYNVDNNNIHDTTDSSQIKKEYQIDIDNDFNFYKDNDISKNSTQKEYWLEEKNRYIQELEKKIQLQENTINNLVKYKSRFEEKIKTVNSNDPKKIPINNFSFSSLRGDLSYDCAHKKLMKKKNKDDIKNKTYNNFNNKSDNDINIIHKRKNNSKDKYNDLYSKYLQLNNDFKYLNNNNEMSQIKNKFDKLQMNYKILKNKIDEKNKIIEKQKNEINQIKNNNDTSNCNIQYIVGGNEEKEVIKKLKQQVESFRKDLVLSQAMVNSLQSEIQQLNKNNVIKNKYNNNNTSSNNKINSSTNNIIDKNKNSLDKYVFTFNDNNSNIQNMSITPSPGRTISYKDIMVNNNDNQQDLIISLNNKNKLLTKVLAENNQLRSKLKKFDSFLPDFVDIEKNEDSPDEINKKVIRKYEEKFKYFNEYIKKMKKNIQQLYESIPHMINKYTNKNENKILSDKFIFDLYELRKDYNSIKKIDSYNLDITDDEKCINIYKKIMKLLNEEFGKIISNKNIQNEKNNNHTNEKNNNYVYNMNKLSINDLNTIKNISLENEKNNVLIENEKQNKTNNNNFNEKKKITYITDYKNKNKKNKTTDSPNGIYNFEYGKNTDGLKFFENNYKTIYDNNIDI